MHVMVAWDVGGGNEVPANVNGAIGRALEGYSWTRPMRGVAIVRVRDLNERDEVVESLIEAVEAVEKREKVDLKLVVSPGMPRGWEYEGYLAERVWKAIEDRSQ